MNLKKIEENTRKYLLANPDEEVKLIEASKRLARNDEITEDEKYVVHPAHYQGGFIIFGGWTKIFDDAIPKGTLGHELYLSFGGVGVGGWKGDCDIELIQDSNDARFTKDGKSYLKPANCDGDPTKGFEWFHKNVKSCMLMYLPQFMQPIPIFNFFDSHSKSIGISVPNAALASFIGGASVKVKK